MMAMTSEAGRPVRIDMAMICIGSLARWKKARQPAHR